MSRKFYSLLSQVSYSIDPSFSAVEQRKKAQEAVRLLARGNLHMMTGRVLTKEERVERLAKVLQYEF